ncbi:MAG: hypothetical protein AAFQ94_18385 [Bacteroidota bacterium]
MLLINAVRYSYFPPYKVMTNEVLRALRIVAAAPDVPQAIRTIADSRGKRPNNYYSLSLLNKNAQSIILCRDANTKVYLADSTTVPFLSGD